MAPQALIFVPIIYWTIAFDATPEKFFYYFIVFFETIAFYSIFGQFLVYCTAAQAIAQVRYGNAWRRVYGVPPPAHLAACMPIGRCRAKKRQLIVAAACFAALPD